MLPQATDYAELAKRFQWQVPQQYNIGVDVCDKWAEAEPERLALIHKSRSGRVSRYSFDDIKRLSNQVANLLSSHGVRAGDRVGVLLPQAPETGSVPVAIYKIGSFRWTAPNPAAWTFTPNGRASPTSISRPLRAPGRTGQATPTSGQ